MTVRLMRSITCVLAACVVIAACQGTAPPPSPTASAALPSGARSAAASPTAKAPLGGTLRVALSAPIGSLDPRLADANPTVASQIFEGLVAPGPNGPAAALATKWLVAADGRTWTFTLPGGVSFHGGTPLDGPAVAKSLDRKSVV